MKVNPNFGNDDNKPKTTRTVEQQEFSSTWVQAEAQQAPKMPTTGDNYANVQKAIMEKGKLLNFTDGTKAFLSDGLYYEVGDDGKPLVPPRLLDPEEMSAKEIAKNEPKTDDKNTPPAKRNNIPPAIKSKISTMRSGVTGLQYKLDDKGLMYNAESVSLINSDFIKYNREFSNKPTNNISTQRRLIKLQQLAVSQAIYQELSTKDPAQLTNAEINFMNEHENNMMKLFKEAGEI